jgi:hypothetical protein
MTAAQLTIDSTSRRLGDVYLYHPAVDLWLVCGGWLVVLAGLNYWLTGGIVQQETIPPAMRAIVLVGTYLISQPHSVATLFKLYGEKTTAKRHSLVSYLLPAILALALLTALKIPELAQLEATLYVALAIHHIMAQCYGIALMYCARAGLRLTQLERGLMQAALWTAVPTAVAQQLSTHWYRHTLLGVQLFQFDFVPDCLVLALQVGAGLSLTALLVLQAVRLYRFQQTMPIPAVLTLMTAVALLTVWNSAGEMIWIFVPPFFHGSQYLCVAMSYFIKKEKSENPAINQARLREFAAIRLTELFAVGLILFVAVPKLLSFTGASFALCSALMFYAISLHHFAADACIWKLRDPAVRMSLSR